MLSWEISNTLDVDFCLTTLERAFEYNTPEIFNTDRGTQFTANAFTGRLIEVGVQINMDGRGRYVNTIFIERRNINRRMINK